MPGTHRRTTAQRGLGWRHRQQATQLKARHIDGTPCWWCNQPMHLTQGLQADHSQPRSSGGIVADRLLHHWCNNERGDGSRDHLRPALTGQTDAKPIADLGQRAMIWP